MHLKSMAQTSWLLIHAFQEGSFFGGCIRRMYFAGGIGGITIFLEYGLNCFFVDGNIQLSFEHAGDHSRTVSLVLFFNGQDYINNIFRGAGPARLFGLLAVFTDFLFYCPFFQKENISGSQK